MWSYRGFIKSNCDDVNDENEGTNICDFLPLKFSHYPSRPVPVPELLGKYPTRPVPKSKTPTRQTLITTHSVRIKLLPSTNFYPEVLTIFSDKAFAANILLAPPPTVAASLHICHMVATNIDMVDIRNIATNIAKHTLYKILHSRICVIEIKLKLVKIVYFVRGKLPKTINNKYLAYLALQADFPPSIFTVLLHISGESMEDLPGVFSLVPLIVQIFTGGHWWQI